MNSRHNFNVQRQFYLEKKSNYAGDNGDKIIETFIADLLKVLD